MPESEQSVRKVSDTYVEVPAVYGDLQSQAAPYEIRPGVNETHVRINGNSLAEMDAEQLIEAVRALTPAVEGRILVELSPDELTALLLRDNEVKSQQQTTLRAKAQARLARALSIEQGSCGSAETPERSAA